MLFVALLAIYAATINTRGLYHFQLHTAVVQALVEHGTLSLRAYDPREPLGDDVFVHHGRVYARRQPGSFLLGAAIYRLLSWCGLTFRRDYYLTAALVSLFTSGALTAATAVLVRRVASDRAAPPGWALGTALAFGLGSTAFPYAGIVHHDATATALVFAAWAARRRPLVAAMLLGLAITSSLLPGPMVAGMAVYLVVAPRPGGGTRMRTAAATLGGLALGAAPLLIGDWVAYGAPWRTALTLGGVWQDTVPRFDLASAIGLIALYGKLLLWYAPIALAGAAGLALAAWQPTAASSGESHAGAAGASAARARLRDCRWMLGLCLAQLAFVATLGTDGRCQYGPRYLLPLMPFLCLGLVAFAGRSWSRAAGAALVVVGVASVAINLVGALYGTMYCDSHHWAFLHYANALRHRVWFSFPLLGIDGQLPY